MLRLERIVLCYVSVVFYTLFIFKCVTLLNNDNPINNIENLLSFLNYFLLRDHSIEFLHLH